MQLVGGPLDGHVCGRRSTFFVYFASYGLGVRAYKQPGPGRYLYRLSPDVANRPGYLYVGHTTHKCDGCGAFVHAPVCPLCLKPKQGVTPGPTQERPSCRLR